MAVQLRRHRGCALCGTGRQGASGAVVPCKEPGTVKMQRLHGLARATMGSPAPRFVVEHRERLSCMCDITGVLVLVTGSMPDLTGFLSMSMKQRNNNECMRCAHGLPAHRSAGAAHSAMARQARAPRAHPRVAELRARACAACAQRGKCQAGRLAGAVALRVRPRREARAAARRQSRFRASRPSCHRLP